MLEVHVWQVDVPGQGGLPQGWTEVLSPQELARAGRFRFDLDRLRYMESHWWLRSIIGATLGVDARCLEFSMSPRGKPWLARPASAWLHFNISRSHHRLAVAIANACEVGVDVEMVSDDPSENLDAMAVLNQWEGPDLADGSIGPERVLRFYQLWTRREAMLKATGAGLGGGLWDGPQWTGRRALPSPLNEGLAPPSMRLSVAQIDFGAGYVGAVAADVADLQLPSFARTLTPGNCLKPT